MELMKKGNTREVSTTTASAGARDSSCSGTLIVNCGALTSPKK